MISWRRTSAAGTVEVLGRSFEVDLDGDKIRIDRLRRREPQDRPLLRELDPSDQVRKGMLNRAWSASRAGPSDDRSG
jgi:hypothetical protein